MRHRRKERSWRRRRRRGGRREERGMRDEGEEGGRVLEHARRMGKGG